MRLTVRHRYDFGPDGALVGDDLVRPEAWDALRTQTAGPFAMAGTRVELDAQLEGLPQIQERARAVGDVVRARGVRRLASYGVGGALVELALHRLGDLEIVGTDYADRTLDRLRELLPELTFVHHDIRRDGPLEADLHLFHRIDTELANREWCEVYRRFAAVPVVVVATEVHELSSLMREFLKSFSGSTRAGWARNRQAFEVLWRSTHDARPLRFHDLEGWHLEPRG